MAEAPADEATAAAAAPPAGQTSDAGSPTGAGIGGNDDASPTAVAPLEDFYDQRAAPDDWKVEKGQMLKNAKKHMQRTACTKQRNPGMVSADDDEWDYYPMWKTSPADLGQLGVGVRLYFEYLKWMGIVFVLLSLLATPAMYFFATGTMLSDDTEFGAYISLLSIANLGICPPEGCRSRKEVYERCAVPFNNDRTCDVQVLDVTQWLGLLDGLGVLLFVSASVFIAKRLIPQLSAETHKTFAMMGDYAVWVWELPKFLPENHADYEKFLADHFTEVLRSCEENVDPDCVQEVIAVREYDGAIMKFTQKGLAMTELDNCLALREKARSEGDEKAVSKCDGKIAKIKKSVRKMDAGLKKQAQMSDEQRGVCSAFVIFKRKEYKDIILNEYRFAQYAIFRLCLSERLRFKGSKINVLPACEPSDLYWENLDFNRWHQRARKALFFLLTILVLVICSVIIAALKSTPSKSDKAVETTWVVAGTRDGGVSSLAFCGWRLHSSVECALYRPSSDTWPVTRVFDSQGNLSVAGALPTDMDCDTVPFRTTAAGTESPWIAVQFEEAQSVRCVELVQLDSSFSSEIRMYACDNAAAASIAAGEHPSEECRAMEIVYPDFPNITTKLRPVLDKSCATDSKDFITLEVAQAAKEKATNKATDITVDCFCKQQARSDLTSFLSPPYETPEQLVCEEWSQYLAEEYGFMVGSIVAVLILNQVLLFLYSYFVTWERLSTVTEVTTSQFVKVFISLFMNTGLLIALINANFQDSLPNFVLFRIFSIGIGDYTDLTAGWFVAVGAVLVITIFGQVFSSTVPQLAVSYIVAPIMARFLSWGAATQQRLNQAYELPAWNLSLRLAQSINVFFCILMYSGGMPVLYVIGALYCLVAYWLDKVCLLRGSHRPPAYNRETLEITVLHIMPWAAFLHVAVAGWAFGNQELFPSRWSKLLPFAEIIFGTSEEKYNEVVDKYHTGVYTSVTSDLIFARLLDFAREGAWLLLLIFVVCIVYYVLYYLWLFLLRPFALPVYLVTMECITNFCPWLRCCRAAKKEASQVDFPAAKSDFASRGKLTTYRLSANPFYEAAAKAILTTDHQVRSASMQPPSSLPQDNSPQSGAGLNTAAEGDSPAQPAVDSTTV
mmetsp:Transcript_19305/g.55336  ORF Transcript_19305/g.55336 Transcript_19305/m.55336 type:complete len:1124 (-) Transcript_19305:61-3432(-)